MKITIVRIAAVVLTSGLATALGSAQVADDAVSELDTALIPPDGTISMEYLETVLSKLAHDYDLRGTHGRHQLDLLNASLKKEDLVSALGQFLKSERSQMPPDIRTNTSESEGVRTGSPSGSNEVRHAERVQAALIWLATIGSTEAEDVIIQELENPLPEDVSKPYYEIMAAATYTLGQCGSERALYLLREMMKDSYWLGRGTQSISTSLRLDEEHMRLALRQLAFTAFYLSGTEAALEILEAGEGFPEYFVQQLPSAIDECHMRLYGVDRSGATARVHHIP